MEIRSEICLQMILLQWGGRERGCQRKAWWEFPFSRSSSSCMSKRGCKLGLYMTVVDMHIVQICMHCVQVCMCLVQCVKDGVFFPLPSSSSFCHLNPPAATDLPLSFLFSPF